MERLLALGADLSRRFRGAARGQVRPVLWEEERTLGGRRYWHGLTDNYIPVYSEGAALGNRLTPVVLGDVYHDGVLAEPMGGER